MMSLEKKLEEMTLERHVDVEQLPDLDLYMDQVIQLFELTYQELKRAEKEKIMTKTMINNYAKGGLISPAKNKRYTKEHVMLIGLIYELKGALALKDIHHMLTHPAVQEHISVRDLYSSFAHDASEKTEVTRAAMKEQAAGVELDAKAYDPYVQQVLLILQLIHQSNVYRRAAEKLIDDLPASE
ncbi:DUF1836 domain-containing protein [Alkalicoccus chagannorensis]|uniref:DUF1836 domain-containing protein n=1 Tax=Alkalicoccus chagannorensis TaxID=427072 RepID=UPI000407738D|nr:DUF1836 domain-containing protein [Alkalicoccus chagannorensis]